MSNRSFVRQGLYVESGYDESRQTYYLRVAPNYDRNLLAYDSQDLDLSLDDVKHYASCYGMTEFPEDFWADLENDSSEDSSDINVRYM